MKMNSVITKFGIFLTLFSFSIALFAATEGRLDPLKGIRSSSSSHVSHSSTRSRSPLAQQNHEQTIFTACEQGNLALLKTMLFDNPELLNSVDENGDSLLHIACAKGNEEIIKFLLNSKINPNVMNNKGLYPIHVAAKYAPNLVRLLYSQQSVKANVQVNFPYCSK